ncbi:site-specific DNA-methyltransferase [Candidatus Bathyarchaeota archaeon]|nr:site-specific DNA-methyltransferase [Candidatus Bathyarchaeota archaeon]
MTERVDVFGDGRCTLYCGDCLEVMASMPDDSVDLVFGSPPYEDCRTYGIGFALEGQAWVDWMVNVVEESLRVCRGLVAFVVEGKTRKFAWSATPVLLMADLHRAGITLRKPPIYSRWGVPGSGGPDWLRNRYEFVVCASRPGQLPWSETTAMGHPPKYGPGGHPSNRRRSGHRMKIRAGHRDGSRQYRDSDGRDVNEFQSYKPPLIANPGNIIDCGAAGGGNIGNKLAHENEAPFPESLAEFFIRSFCPPGGTTLDPYSGSGTTMSVALHHSRKTIGIDVRQSQIDLAERRLRMADGQSLFSEV